jgi:hypothetical protein
MKKLLVAAVVALALPSLARAGDVSMRVQEVPLGTRTLAAITPAISFNMLAVHWIGSGSVSYRTRASHGGWRPWTTADADVSPDGGTGTWHDGNLDWSGASDAVQFRTSGTVRRLRAYELWSRVSAAPTRRLSEASSPPIVSRSGWDANEEIVRAKPSYAPTLKLAIVHHTAGTNNYTRAQAAAIVRGIEVYHVQGNGWNDIGYNFLVDRFGTVYEGRAGGMTRNVIGAHAEGFNTGSVGIALIGNFTSASPTAAQQAALVKLLAWRLDVAHVDPLSTVTLASRGNAKYPAGKVVKLRAISGHRDTGPSECPGNAVYALLPSLAKRVSNTALPKLYAPTTTGKLGAAIRFEAQLSSSLPWTVTVADAGGTTVAHGAGTGTKVRWTWTSPAAKGVYVWTISAPGVRPATGTIGSGRAAPPPPTPGLSGLQVSPGLVAPAAGVAAAVTARFVLGATAKATVTVTATDGTTLTLEDGTLPAGPNTVRFDAGPLADGLYTLQVTAKSVTTQTASAPFTVDRTLTGLAASAAAVSPNADGAGDTVSFAFVLSQPVPVQLTIQQNGVTVATPYTGQLPVGAATIAWDGTSGAGTPLPDGAYVAVLTYTDSLGTQTQTIPIAVDTVAPVLTAVDLRALSFTLSEPATLTLVVNGAAPLVLPEPQGAFHVPYAGTVTTVTAQAVDAGGNKSALLSGP